MTSYPALLLLLLSFLFLGLKPSASLQYKEEESPDILCIVCQTVMEVLDQYITEENTEQEVADALGQICALLPEPLNLECQAMIQEYTDDIIELIVNQFLSPSQVCSKLGLCTA